MVRFLGAGEMIDVTLDANGSPKQFVWRGRAHPVLEEVDRWRTDEDWWRFPVRRDYYKLATTTNMLVILYHNLATEKWYLQLIGD